MTWRPERSEEPELIDGNLLSVAERQEALVQLPLVNRLLGGIRVVLLELAAIAADKPATTRLRVLDVGCGVGDIPHAIVRWAARARRSIDVVGLDRDEATLALSASSPLAPEQRIVFVRGSASQLPASDRSFDVVTASMFCHHFHGDELIALLSEMTRVADEAVIINDLHRHRIAYWAFSVFSRVFLRGQVIRHDGAVSIQRGFVPDELRSLAGHFPAFSWTVKRRLAFRLCLAGRRNPTA